MLGHDEKDRLTEAYLEDRPMMGVGASEDFEAFVAQIDRASGNGEDLGELTVEEVKRRVAERGE